MLLSATAWGRASGGTCSLTEACQAGPNRATPLPMMKQELSRMAGVIMPRNARVARPAAPRNEIVSPTIPTIRRSYMSAMAPEATDTSMAGNMDAVWTRATRSAARVSWVMAQAAPTPWISSPRLDSRLPSHMARNRENRRGPRAPPPEPPPEPPPTASARSGVLLTSKFRI